VADGDLVSEHAEVAQRNASAVARERLGSDDDARHEHHDDDVEGAAGECIPSSTSLVDGEACTVRVLFSPSRREILTSSSHEVNPPAYLHFVTELIVQGCPQSKLRDLLPDRVLACHPELYVGDRSTLPESPALAVLEP